MSNNNAHSMSNNNHPLPLYAISGKSENALVILEHRLGQTPQVVLSPNLRHSGLLRVMPPELLQVFVALLTFQDGRGEIKANIAMIAEALDLHPDKVEVRLQTLSTFSFDGASFLFETTISTKEKAYALSKRVGVSVNVPKMKAHDRSEKPYRPVPMETVIQQSREKYGTPRAEAEAIVAEQMGIMPTLPIPEGREGEAYRAMLVVGITDQEARNLLAENPLEVIEEQIAWLPVRGARNPARFLSAAIRDNYASPQSRGYDATGATNNATGATNNVIEEGGDE
jgi:hypothetical protein